MDRIICLGNSLAGMKALELIRAARPESELSVLATENVLPYHPARLAAWVAKHIPEEDLYCQTQDFYKTNRIELIFEKRIARINFRKNQIVTEEKEIFPFDMLLLSDTPQVKFFDLKGGGKAGVFSAGRLSDIKNLLNSLPAIDTLIIQVSDWESLRLAAALLSTAKEVVVLCPGASFLPQVLEPESSLLLMKFLQEKGMRILPENEVVEVLGENDVKAVRLKSKKVLACEALVLGSARPDFRLLADTPLQTTFGLTVDENFVTSLKHVYAFDRMISPKSGEAGGRSTDTLEEQGKIMAAAIGKAAYAYPPIIFQELIQLPGLTAGFLGEVKLPLGGQIHHRLVEADRSYKKIFLDREGILRGAILFNALNSKDQCLQWLRQGVCVLGREQELL